MTFVAHSEEAGKVYQQMADDAAWARMKDRVGDDPVYDELRKLYAGE